MDKKQSDVTQGVAKTLYGLGFSQSEILRLLKISRTPRLVRTLAAAKQEYPNRATGRAAFAPKLKAFCALRVAGSRKWSDEDRGVYAVLDNVLKIAEHDNFFGALKELASEVATLRAPATDKRYYQLIRATFQLRQKGPEEYWKQLAEKEVLPNSYMALHEDMVIYVGAWCRAQVLYAWPEHGRRAIDGIIDTLNPRIATILRQRFGLGDNKPMLLEEVGFAHNATREHIRQIEAKGLRQLAAGPRGVLLGALFLTPLTSSRQLLTPEQVDKLVASMRAEIETAQSSAA